MSSSLLELGERIQRGLQQSSAEFRSRHRDFLLSRQLPTGGFAGRDVDLQGNPVFDDGVQADLYYTAFAVRGLAALEGFDTDTAELVGLWLQPFASRLLSVIDVVSWLYTAAMVQAACGKDLLADVAADWPTILAGKLEQLRCEDGGYAKSTASVSGSTYHSYLVVLCYQLIGQTLPDVDRLVQFIIERQREDGGFVEMAAMRRSGTNPTAAAIGILNIYNAMTSPIRTRAVNFFEQVRGDDGGFQANTRIPFSDALSTFTGYLTCLDIGHPELLPTRKLARYLKELELPTGGFLAAGWDRTPDVEYTFYALGTQGLLNAQTSANS
ncbi:geranyl transferase [bacterium]|nr:geranyl transferase [bacterium]